MKAYLSEHPPVSCKVVLENITLSHDTMVKVFIIKHEQVISTAVATVLPVSIGYHVHRLLPKHECEIGRGGSSCLCPGAASCCSHMLLPLLGKLISNTGYE